MMLRGYGWRDDPAPTRQPQMDSAAGIVFFVATLMYCILFRVIPIFLNFSANFFLKGEHHDTNFRIARPLLPV